MGNRNLILGALKRGRPFFGTPLGDTRCSHFFKDLPEEGKLFEQFAERLGAVRGECYPAFSKQEVGEVLLTLLSDVSKRALYLEAPILKSLLKSNPEVAARLEGAALSRHADLSNELFSQFEVGITGADYLVARTGSVVIRSSTQGGRRLSIMPKFHIVLAYDTQLVATLGDCLADLKVDPSWSSASIVTGPSRTADIEKTLVLGAHGPQRLAVIVERGRGFL